MIIGITPKQYARMIRLKKFNRLMARKAKPDQAHFTLEFKHYAVASPSRFLRTQEGYSGDV